MVSTDVTGDQIYTYATAGNHTVWINGSSTHIHLNNDATNAPKLVSINQWGDIQWSSMEGAFHSTSNMKYMATDVPDLSLVTDMSSMFQGATMFNGDISAWNVSKVTSMRWMFWGGGGRPHLIRTCQDGTFRR